MNDNHALELVNRKARQALVLWGVFIGVTVLVNGTILFILGVDMQEWTYSPIKDVLFNLVTYSGLYLVVPLILIKGWATVRQRAFLVPLTVAVVAMTARTFVRPVAVLAVIMLAYLHWRFNLSELGIRSRGWRGDLIAILFIGLLILVPKFFQPISLSFAPAQALLTSLDRLFANPATTTENLFYFGFLAERLSYKTGRWLTPLIIGFMYTLHEMSNPEYWYENVSFIFVFIGVTVITAVYLWRRSTVVLWLGDGLGRFLGRLF